MYFLICGYCWSDDRSVVRSIDIVLCDCKTKTPNKIFRNNSMSNIKNVRNTKKEVINPSFVYYS
jgi:hypothetical protein